MSITNLATIISEHQARLFPVHSPLAPFQPGDRITAAYRDYRWRGTVLAVNDAKSWRGTLFFGYATQQDKSQQEIDNHCDRWEIYGIKRVPVAWDFGKVYWEDVESIELVRGAL